MMQSVTQEVVDQRTVVKLVSDWIFGGYSLGSSRDMTEARLAVLAAGGRLAHLPEPHAESLETDLGTYADKTQLLWTLLASQAGGGASGGVFTKDSGANIWAGGKSTENTTSLYSTFHHFTCYCFFILHYPEPLKLNFVPIVL